MTIDYAVEHLWLLTSAVYVIGGGELKTPPYIELAHPEEKHKDARSAEEIKQYILERLSE